MADLTPGRDAASWRYQAHLPRGVLEIMTNEELQAIEARAAAGIKIALKGFGLPPDAYEALRDDVPALVADLRRLRELARAVLPAAHAGIHFAFHEGNAPEHGREYRAAYDALAAALDGEGQE